MILLLSLDKLIDSKTFNIGTDMGAKLTLVMTSDFNKIQLVNALRIFADELEKGRIKNGKGLARGGGFYREYTFEEKE